eukprot:scaffold1516_cov363-Pavlova_lutheri.AAC.1
MCFTVHGAGYLLRRPSRNAQKVCKRIHCVPGPTRERLPVLIGQRGHNNAILAQRPRKATLKQWSATRSLL